MQNTHTHTHIQDVSVCLKDRDGEIQTAPTDGYHASGKEQVWTVKQQLLPEQEGMRGKRTQTIPTVYTEWVGGKIYQRYDTIFTH